MKVLVIGGSIFIGKHLVYMLAKQDHEITVLNRGTREIAYPQGTTHCKADRKNKEQLTEVLADQTFDWVFDLCAYVGDDTRTVVEILNDKVEHFIHISTAGVTFQSLLESGKLIIPFFEEDVPISTLKPSSDEPAYIQGKKECEILLQEFYEKNGFPFTSIRPTFVYGPDNPLYREAYFFDRLSRDRPVFMPKPGNMLFDLVHVDDVAQLAITAARHSEAIGECYNCSGGEFITGEQLTQLLGKIMDKPPQIEYFTPEMLQKVNWPERKRFANLRDHIPDFVQFPIPFGFSMLKAAHHLGFVPQYRLKDGLTMTYEWWLQQKREEPDWTLENQLLNIIDIEKKRV
ncbi:MAG: NAD-dependent epimerase/dehydratase family protein [Candidatus Hodarchaeota archaeon]